MQLENMAGYTLVFTFKHVDMSTFLQRAINMSTTCDQHVNNKHVMKGMFSLLKDLNGRATS